MRRDASTVLGWLLLLAASASACRASPPSVEDITVWRSLGAWSGRGVLQTEAFISDTGVLRVSWEARGARAAGEETLRIFLHSAVSGRQLVQAVDQRGPGRDVAYVSEDPRSFYLVIESANLEWSVEAAEGVAATRQARDPPR
jgi:hypothetical protein